MYNSLHLNRWPSLGLRLDPTAPTLLSEEFRKSEVILHLVTQWKGFSDKLWSSHSTHNIIIYSITSCLFRNYFWKCRAMVVVKHFIFLLFFYLKVKKTKEVPHNSARGLKNIQGHLQVSFSYHVFPHLFPKEHNVWQHFSYTADKSRSSNQ